MSKKKGEVTRFVNTAFNAAEYTALERLRQARKEKGRAPSRGAVIREAVAALEAADKATK